MKIGAAIAPPAAVATVADAIEASSPWRDAARAAAHNAPYLARLMARRQALFAEMDQAWPERVTASAISAARAIACDPPALEEGMAALRAAKQQLHVAVALADLARALPLERITGALTDFADASLAAAISLTARTLTERGELTAASYDSETGPVPGVAFIALGKMGAGELNYSSDVDFSIFYEPSALPIAAHREARSVALRIVQLVVRAMEEITAEGYVFRTDLRLRPDPASTPPAVTIAAAEIYYQSLGQNWERAAFIKARAAAGDVPLGRSFLRNIETYVWRRNLNYEAVNDVFSIKRQILAARGGAALEEAAFDVKLGRGGIRDIELHAQTQQLVRGGRDRSLRAPTTLGALAALAQADVIARESAEILGEAYGFYRDVEHRVQMLEDAQTHKTPADPTARGCVAALSGFNDLAAFDAALITRRKAVFAIDHALFGRFVTLADPLGSLSFTGVEDDPETLATLARLGFKDAAFAVGTIRGWHHGRVRAMRAERARELLTKLTPTLLRAIAATGAPDQTFQRFAEFFGRLNAGVQLLALFDAQPKFLQEVVSALALAPRLAETLARRPALLDAMIEARFERPLAEDPPGERGAATREAVDGADSFEAALNAARRLKREETFRIAMQVLNGRAEAETAGAAHADLAEAMVEALADAALREVERLHGRQPGAFAVMALGKFGGRELAEGSDLDIMVVYEAEEGALSGGPRAVGPVDFYARLTQRLISALAAPTEEGLLYDVDMQLRPSGSKGPVAVRLSSFARYYGEDAWTWELLALTRLRPVGGDAALGARVLAAAESVLQSARDGGRVAADVADMRARMERERPARDMWDLKLAPGGFVDIEFIVQAAQLLSEVRAANTGQAIARLAAAGALSGPEAAALREAWAYYSRLHQALRICVEGEFDPSSAPEGLTKLLARAAGADSFSSMEQQLQRLQAQVRDIFRARFGDGTPPPPR